METIRSSETSADFQQIICFVLVSFLAYCSSLQIEATCSSETSAGFQRTRRYTPEDRTLYNHRCENLKSYICTHLSCIPRVLHATPISTFLLVLSYYTARSTNYEAPHYVIFSSPRILALTTKYSLQHPVLEHPHSIFFL
jgi:hypothetical protein